MAPPLAGKLASCSSIHCRDSIVNADEVWIFGYGSLIWKTNFPYSNRLAGRVEGYKRRFWQGSTDHRGTPGKPGRVATLVEEQGENTWGFAFQVQKSHVPEVVAYLNHREKGGYTTKIVTFYPRCVNMEPFDVLLYIATPDNEEFLGDASLDDIAYQIALSCGPSGKNSEYLLCLADSFRLAFPDIADDHLFALEKRVKEFLHNNNNYTDTKTN